MTDEITAGPPGTPQSCGVCRFYRLLIDGSARGHCVRHAPGPPFGPTQPPLWAIVGTDEWCGEFEAGLIPAPQRAMRRRPTRAE